MVTDPTRLQRLAAMLASPIRTPSDDASAATWEAWMQVVDVDSQTGGWLSHAVAGVPVDLRLARSALAALEENPAWRDVLPERYDLLVEALCELTGA